MKLRHDGFNAKEGEIFILTALRFKKINEV
jgi:hypothetical protein